MPPGAEIADCTQLNTFKQGFHVIPRGGDLQLIYPYSCTISHDALHLSLSIGSSDRFDPEGRGCVTLVDFLNKLGVKHDGKSSASVPPGSADEAGRGRDPDVLSEAAELLE